ncbi:MAG: L-type lectin-domain containing protein [Terriglobales bacterium]
MKVAISRFVVVAAIAALVVVGGSTAAWATCPTSPNYTPDFTANGPCLATNYNAALFTSDNTVLRLTKATGDQVGSAWDSTPQPVQQGFSTSFQFQFTNASTPPADGIAFVIQNVPGSPTTAIGYTGGNGGALGYGDSDASTNPSTGAGIPNSLAIEFDTYQNGWDPGANDSGSVSHVAIQSCGQGANTSHHGRACNGQSGSSTPGSPVSVANLADGAVHSVTIVYALACPTCATRTQSNNLHVILDNVDLYPSGVPVDLASIGLGTGNTAYVGFTGATGGDYEIQDILNWTFTPQAQSASLPAVNVPAVIPFNGGPGNNAYDYNAVLTGGGVTSWTAQIKPILIDRKACNKLVQQKFPLAQCFVYQNAGTDGNGKGIDSSVLFALTCPGSAEDGTCGDNNQDFFADLGSNFTFSKAENPGFQLLAATIGPYPGWLKGSGPDSTDPCNFTNSTTAPFVSNQISSFFTVGDPLATTKGKSGGGGSCWVATYATTGELPPGINITAPAFKTYSKSTTPGTAYYTCSDPKTSQPPDNPVGPYLTAATCSQSQAPNVNNTSCSASNVSGTISCTGQYDLSVKGLHLFTVTAKDTAGNVNVNVVIYSVK